MRVVPWSGSPDAVVRVDHRGDVFVAVPRGLPVREVLDLARLVLTSGEFEEFARLLDRDAGRVGGAAGAAER